MCNSSVDTDVVKILDSFTEVLPHVRRVPTLDLKFYEEYVGEKFGLKDTKNRQDEEEALQRLCDKWNSAGGTVMASTNDWRISFYQTLQLNNQG